MKKRYSGFSLIEVLISLVILVLILLGFNALQIVGLRETRNAYYFSLAVNQIKSMQAMLHSTGDHAQQITKWNQQNGTILPQGNGSVVGDSPNYTISIFWGVKTSDTVCRKIQLGKINCLVAEVNV